MCIIIIIYNAILNGYNNNIYSKKVDSIRIYQGLISCFIICGSLSAFNKNGYQSADMSVILIAEDNYTSFKNSFVQVETGALKLIRTDFNYCN